MDDNPERVVIRLEKTFKKRHSRTSRGEVLGKKRKTNDEDESPMEHEGALGVTTDGAPVPGACAVERPDAVQLRRGAS